MRHPLGPRKNCSRNCRPRNGSSLREPHHPIHYNWCWRLCWSLGGKGATPSLLGPPPEETPPVRPIALPTADDYRHTLPGLADSSPEGNATVLSTKPGTKDWLTQLIPTAAPVVELTCPTMLSDQTKEERQYMLVVTALVRRLNLEATGVILRDTVTALAGGVTFQNPQMGAALSGPTGGRGVIASTAMEELVGKGAEWEWHYWPTARRRGQ